MLPSPKAFLKILVGLTLSLAARAKELAVATDVGEDYSAKDERGYYIDLVRTIFPAPECSLKFEFTQNTI